MTELTIEAPAKLNLHLRIKEKRPDGFHNLESIFMALVFRDTLHFEPLALKNALEISVEGCPFTFPIEENIVFKAISLFRRRTGYDQGLRVTLEKRIPLGGGLGGGSSDAASSLLALNSLYRAAGNTPLDAESLGTMALSLGSDVPFFLSESGAAWVSGQGEGIKPLKTPGQLFFTLVNPGFPSETAEAFRLLDESRGENASPVALSPTALSPEALSPEALSPTALIQAFSGPPRNWPFANDFLPVFEGRAGTAYRKILAQLRDAGAEFAGLSGAGATCFGVFTEPEPAEKAALFLIKDWKFTNVTIPLAYMPLLYYNN
jgi:4-diphosphocytidyl-2-C-methyl-D-erythritol kinase